MAVVGTWNLENLYRPGGRYGPRDDAAYRAKLTALAATITREDLDVVAVQEVGDPDALGDLAALLPGSPPSGEPGGGWATALSGYPDARGIRVGFVSRLPMEVIDDVAAFPDGLAAVQIGDATGGDAGDGGETTDRMGRGALAARVFLPGDATGDDQPLTLVTCHLKSKLLSFPGGRFAPRDEGERARYGAYALYRRAAEAVAVRALASRLLDDHDGEGRGHERRVVVLGDLNDGPDAATTQLLHGPPGSQLGTAGAGRPDRGDGMRLWNLAARIPQAQRFSRVYRGRGELIDHVLVSRALLDATTGVCAVVDRALPSVGDDPAGRRDAGDSDHAPVVVRVEV